MVRRTCLMCHDDTAIGVKDISDEMIGRTLEQEFEVTNSVESSAEHTFLKARDVTLEILRTVLVMVNYNKTKAAQVLGIDRKTIYNKLKIVAACL